MFDIIGPAAANPEVQKSARKMRRRYHTAALTLLERLLVEGADKQITLEDIEQLISLEKTAERRSPAFMRKIVIEIMVCLRPKS